MRTACTRKGDGVIEPGSARLRTSLPRSAKRAEWWDDDTPEHPRDQAQAIHQAGYDSRRTPDGTKVRFRRLSTLPRQR